MNKTKIELGGGRFRKQGDYINIDLQDADIIWDLENGLPPEIGGNSMEEVYAHHLLEHICEDHINNLLKDCFKVLKSGGFLDIYVPDLGWAIKKLTEENDFNTFYMMVYGSPTLGILEMHKTGFTEQRLKDKLIEVGFEILDVDYPDFYGQNLHIVGGKP